MPKTGLSAVIVDRRINAVLAWLVVGVLVVTAVAAAAAGQVLWAGFSLVVALLGVLPGIAYRGFDAMLPWEVLVLAAVPVAGRFLVAGQTILGFTFTGRIATYLAVAAIALIVAVELDLFTDVVMNHSFAVFFVVITTMAAAGVWAVVQWLSDLSLGTSFLLDGRPEEVIETTLMWDFVAATVAGILAGIVFEYYFRRHARVASRLPSERFGRETAK